MAEKRHNVRHKIGVLTALTTQENKFICFGVLEDVSAEGAKVKLTKEVELPDNFTIVLASKCGPRRSCSVVWRKTDRVGVRFTFAEEQSI
jgi:hypothetical protein